MKNKTDKTDNRLIFVEPNCSDRDIPNPEDYSIFVELKSTSKSRSVITNNGVSNEGNGESRPIGFLDGSNVGGKRRSLTTNYTEIGTNFGDDAEDLETLGIESIDISFDTAYTPIIRIKFIDIRGNAVLERGNKSRYKMFFELPFPLFELTVKGFYGKAVTYCLHLTKWNASFNSGTGNFEIATEFIGYTYALLTDCLLGYMRAAALTKIGESKFLSYQSMTKESGSSERKYPNLMRIDKFLDYVSQINDEFTKIKQDNDVVKQINVLTTLSEDLDGIERLLTHFKEFTLSGSESKNDMLKGKNDNLVVLPNALYSFNSSSKDKIDDKKKNLEFKLAGLIKIYNKKIDNVADFKLKPEDVKISISSISRDNSGTIQTSTSRFFDTSIAFNELEKKGFLDQINNGENVYVFTFTTPFDKIGKIRDLIKKRRKNLDNELTNVLKEKVKTLKFRPTIRNIVNMLAIHAQILLETIKQVSNNAEKVTNTGRKEAISSLLTVNENKPLYAWPEYKKQEEGNWVEAWMGSELTTSSYKKVDEIMFVDELLKNLMKIGRADEIRALAGSADTPDFFPVSPAEAKIDLPSDYGGDTIKSLITTNPYREALLSDRSLGTTGEAIRCLLIRIFTSLGVTNRLTKDPLYLKTIGKLEAENLFKVVNSEYDKIPKNNFFNIIKDMMDVSSLGAAEEVIKTWTEGTAGDAIHPPSGRGQNGKLFYKKDDVPKADKTIFIYDYITNSSTYSYLPISGGFDGRDFYDTTGTFKTYSSLLESSETLLFTSNRGLSELGLDGSFYLKILVDNKGNHLAGSPSVAESDILEKYKEKVGPDSLIIEKDLKASTYNSNHPDTGRAIVAQRSGIIPINMYNGIYKTLQIDEIIFEAKDDIEPPTLEGKDFVAKAYFLNREGEDSTYDSYRNQGGFFLAANSPKKSSKAYKQYSLKNPNTSRTGFIGVYCSNTHYAMKAENNSAGPHYDGDFDYINKAALGNLPEDWGNQKELVSSIIENGVGTNYVPFIDFTVKGKNSAPLAQNVPSETIHNLSLFGSLFYNYQSKDGKCFLFLNSIGWEGVSFSVDGIEEDVSLFTNFDRDDDTTYTIKGLFSNNGSIIKAPKLWCAFIGSLLYRREKEILKWKLSKPLYLKTYLIPFQRDDSYVPAKDEYLHINGSFRNGGIFLDMSKTENDDYENYAQIDSVLRELPKAVKNEFKRIFFMFRDNNFKEIQEKYELFTDVQDQRKKWLNLVKKVGSFNSFSNKRDNKFRTTREDYFHKGILYGSSRDIYTSVQPVYKWKWQKGNLGNATDYIDQKFLKKSDLNDVIGVDKIKNYDNISPINNQLFQEAYQNYHRWAGHTIVYGKGTEIYNFYQFDLSLANNTENKTLLTLPFAEEYQIINAAPRIFRKYEAPNNSFPYKGDDLKIFVDSNDFKAVLVGFFDRMSDLLKDISSEDDDRIQQRIFNNVDDDIIKLNIYRTLSSINDKWLGSDLNKSCGNINEIADSFRFLDSGFLDIGDDFLINPLGIRQKIINNYNQSFFDLVNGLLIENNFNFIALPSYIDFTTPDKMKADVFTPIPWSEKIQESASSPSFVCVYTGQQSSNLDLGSEDEHEDDGVYIKSEGSCETTTTPLGMPKIFKTEQGQKGQNIPYFLVSYGKGNQSIFKDIKLDQREFTETAESLEIIDDLSNNANKNKATYKGQNLFNVYQKRAYSAEVEMMGNVTIQPMMYFQLNNIPMFKGAYLIYNTTHNITAHSMKTTFKGSRIKNVKTPLITEAQLFQSLIGPVSEGGRAEQVSGEAIATSSSIKYSDWIDTPMDVNMLPINNDSKSGKTAIPKLVHTSTTPKIKFGMREVVELLQKAFTSFIAEVEGLNSTNINTSIFWNDLSHRGGGLAQGHKTHQKGVDIDFRQITSNIETTSLTSFSKLFFEQKTNAYVDSSGKINGFKTYYYNGNKPIKLIDPAGDNRDEFNGYSRKGTRILIKKIRELLGKRMPGDIVLPKLRIILFNDPVLIDEGLCHALPNHNNHLHVSFLPPARVEKEMNDKVENSRKFSN